MGNGTSCRSVRSVIKLQIRHFVIWFITHMTTERTALYSVLLLLFIVGYVYNRMVISYIVQRTKQSFID